MFKTQKYCNDIYTFSGLSKNGYKYISLNQRMRYNYIGDIYEKYN